MTLHPFRFRVALVAIIVPIALTVIGVAIQLAWLPLLPDTIATHWGFDGVPDAFGPAWSMPVVLAVLGLVLPLLLGLIVVRTMTPAGPTVTHKILAAASVFAATVLSIIVTGSLAIQVYSAPEGTTADILPWLAIAIGSGLVLAMLGWFVMPRAISGQSSADVAVAPIPIAAGERVAWVGHAQFPQRLLIGLAIGIVVMLGAFAFLAASTAGWGLLIVPVVVAVSLAGTASWRVRVDSEGLSVRAALGWPHYRYPVTQLISAGTTTVTALGEFGGYGIRFGADGRLGIITRSGEALEVRRSNGRGVVITVDDAATAAGLLTTLIARPEFGAKR